MPGVTVNFQGPADSEVAIVARTTDDTWIVSVSVADFTRGLEVKAICAGCNEEVATGMTVLPRDVPLHRAGRWRHEGCGGMAEMPDGYLLTDRRTGDEIDLYRGAMRQTVTLSAITLTELLHLAQAAKAVQEGRPGATDRLDRVLADAPEPVRRLRDRLGPMGWIALATLLLMFVQTMTPILKDDGNVTEQQIVDVLERLIKQQSGTDVADTEPSSVEKTKSTDKQEDKRKGLTP